MRACVAPVCDFKSEVEVVTHNGKSEPCWGNVKEVLLENIRKILGSKIVQVKGLMPPEDGIRRETPTGRAVGGNVVWHNFLCCPDICYALGEFYRDCHVVEKSRMLHGIIANKTFSILCFSLGVKGISHPPYTPLCVPL